MSPTKKSLWMHFYTDRKTFLACFYQQVIFIPSPWFWLLKLYFVADHYMPYVLILIIKTLFRSESIGWPTLKKYFKLIFLWFLHIHGFLLQKIAENYLDMAKQRLLDQPASNFIKSSFCSDLAIWSRQKICNSQLN